MRSVGLLKEREIELKKVKSELLIQNAKLAGMFTHAHEKHLDLVTRCFAPKIETSELQETVRLVNAERDATIEKVPACCVNCHQLFFLSLPYLFVIISSCRTSRYWLS